MISTEIEIFMKVMMLSWCSHTNRVSFAEMPSDHVVHVVILTQVQLQQIDFYFTVLHKHAMLNHLGKID